MDNDRPARRPPTAAIIGIVIGVVFLALAVLAYLFGGGPIVALIAAIGGVLTLAAAVFTLVRP